MVNPKVLVFGPKAGGLGARLGARLGAPLYSSVAPWSMLQPTLRAVATEGAGGARASPIIWRRRVVTVTS